MTDNQDKDQDDQDDQGATGSPFSREMRRIRDMVDPPALRAMREQQERIRDMVDPPALRAMREQQEAFRASFPFIDRSDSLHGILSSNVLGQGARFFETVMRTAHHIGAAENAASAGAGISALLSRDHVVAFGPTGELLQAGARLFGGRIEDSPVKVLGEVPAEIFRAVDADAALEDAEVGEVAEQRTALSRSSTAELDDLLASFEPELLPMLNGARRALDSDYPDRARHVCVSLRELIGHLLRRLAPDDAIREWSTSGEHYHNGNPTRGARLKYLYRSIEGPELKAFIAADVKATVELLDALNRGTHVSKTDHCPQVLTILLSRTEGALLLLLRVRNHESGA